VQDVRGEAALDCWRVRDVEGKPVNKLEKWLLERLLTKMLLVYRERELTVIEDEIADVLDCVTGYVGNPEARL
jgi:hypothetical protein